MTLTICDQSLATTLSIAGWGNERTAQIMCEVSRKLTMDLPVLIGRYGTLLQDAPAFLTAIKMSKGTNIDKVKTLTDVIDSFTFLRNSPSIGKCLRTDLVREYLSIVNVIRIKCDEVQQDIGRIRDFDEMDNEITSRLAEVETMLEPAFNFSDLNDLPDVDLSPAERRSFTGLLSFMSVILRKLGAIIDFMPFGNVIDEHNLIGGFLGQT